MPAPAAGAACGGARRRRSAAGRRRRGPVAVAGLDEVAGAREARPAQRPAGRAAEQHGGEVVDAAARAAAGVAVPALARRRVRPRTTGGGPRGPGWGSARAAAAPTLDAGQHAEVLGRRDPPVRVLAPRRRAPGAPPCAAARRAGRAGRRRAPPAGRARARGRPTTTRACAPVLWLTVPGQAHQPARGPGTPGPRRAGRPARSTPALRWCTRRAFARSIQSTSRRPGLGRAVSGRSRRQ